MDLIHGIFNALFGLHPLHTMFVHFPIALTSSALLFIVLGLVVHSEHLERAAYYLSVLVVLGTAAASISGMSDNLSRYDGMAPNAHVKVFLAVSLFILSLVLVISRARNAKLLWRKNTVILYVAAYVGCFVLAAALGFFGGVIVYGF
mgnify:CR=1 FL=1